jgi:hypothetical protein
MSDSATVLQQQTIGDTATDWSQTIPFNQFDPSQGTLQSIGVGLTADLNGSVSVESLEAAPSTVLVTQYGDVSVSSPTDIELADVTPYAFASVNLGAYDGTPDYAGASGTILPLSNTVTSTTTFAAGGADLGPLIGTGSIALAALATASLNVQGPANLLVQSQASAGAVVELQYDYSAPGTGSSSGDDSSLTYGSFTTIGVPISAWPLFQNYVTSTPQTLTFADRTTGSSGQLAIHQFDPALGTLEAINVTVSGDLSTSVAAENEDTAPAVITVNQDATVTLALPGATDSTSAPVVSSVELGGYDGTVDFAGSSGTIDQSQALIPAVAETLTDATDLAAFTGSGTLGATISTSGASSLAGPGNLLARLLAEAGGTVTVDYTYLPAGVASDAIGWENQSGGEWTDAINWSSYFNPPASGDDVAITQAGTYTVTLDAAETIHSIVIDAPDATLVLDGNLTTTGDLILDAGTIDFNGGTISAGDITMNGGLITGDTVDLNSAGTIAVNGGLITGATVDLNAIDSITLDGDAVAVTGAVDLTAASGSLTIGSIEFPGDVTSTTLSDSDAVFYGAPAGFGLVDDGQGDTVVGSAGATLLTLSGSDDTFYGESGAIVVFDSGHNDTLLGGSSQSTFQLTSGATDELVFGGSASVSMSDAGNDDTLVGAAGPTAVTLSGADATFYGESGAITVLDSGRNDTLLAGSSQSTFQLTSGATDELVFGGAASVSISDAGSHDTLVGSTGPTAVTLSGSDALFFSEADGTSVFDSGQGDTIVAGTAATAVTTSGGGAMVFGGAASVSMLDSGNHDTLIGSAGPTAATLSGSDALVFSEAGGASILDNGQSDTIVAGTAATAVTAGGSGLVVFGGTGPLSFIGGAGGATIVDGSGTASITGGSGGITLYGGADGAIDYSGTAGGLQYEAGSGNETLDASGSTTNDLIYGGLDPTGRNSIVGGAGTDTIVGGAGNDTLVGGSGHDLFTFVSANGAGAPNDLVVNFNGNDTVWLVGYGAAAAAAAVGTAASSDGSTTVTLSDNTTITFAGLASATSLVGHVIST